MIWIKLAAFALAIGGAALTQLYKTYRRDKADAKHSVTMADVIWTGPARWKTILNVAFLAAVCFFVPPEYLQSAVATVGGGAELGYAVPILFGIASEGIMLKLFKKAMQAEGDEK